MAAIEPDGLDVLAVARLVRAVRELQEQVAELEGQLGNLWDRVDEVSASRNVRFGPMFAGLSRAEWRVADLLVEGLTNRQIAERLDLSQNTIKMHVSAILEKSATKTRERFVACALNPQVRSAVAS